MNRWIALILILSAFTALSAAEDYLGLRAGFLAPDDAKTGFMCGVSQGKIIDEAVQIRWNMDFYKKSFSEKRALGVDTTDAGNHVTTMRMTTDIDTYFLPLTMGVRVNIPLETRIQPFVGGDLGWGLLWEKVYVAANDTHGEIDQTKFYNGLDWVLSAGGRMELGTRSWLTGEIFYNGGAMKRNVERNSTGVTWDQIDMKGIGMRLGVEFRY